MLILMVQGCLKSPRCLLHDVCSAGHRFRGAPLLASRHGDLSPGDPAVNLLKQHPPCRGMEKSLAGKGRKMPSTTQQGRRDGEARTSSAPFLLHVAAACTPGPVTQGWDLPWHQQTVPRTDRQELGRDLGRFSPNRPHQPLVP